ncbi:MAG: endolytic transglycosylase MltG [Candidatus Zixiibacteriota bacterium]
MRPEHEFITVRDWIAFFVSTLLIFLSSLLLIISGALFFTFRLAKKRPVLFFLSLLALIILILAIQCVVLPVRWRAEGNTISVIVREGDNMHRIIARLKEADLLKNGTPLLILSELIGRDRHIRAGRYDFRKGITLVSVFHQLFEGNVILKEVTIPEGLTAKEIAGILEKEIQLDSSEFMKAVTDSQLAQTLSASASNLEGYLFPDTYKLPWGTSCERIAEMMVNRFKEIFTDSLAKRADSVNLSKAQVVTLASLIEAEAKQPEEREIISAVFHNRLKLGMLLQCCPTVTYGLPHVNRPLTLKELETESPYNTYEHPGLPPGPICNPGKASIVAALYPASVDYLYFVAKGDGTHVFSTTLREHDRAKNKIRQAQKPQT